MGQEARQGLRGKRGSGLGAGAGGCEGASGLFTHQMLLGCLLIGCFWAVYSSDASGLFTHRIASGLFTHRIASGLFTHLQFIHHPPQSLSPLPPHSTRLPGLPRAAARGSTAGRRPASVPGAGGAGTCGGAGAASASASGAASASASAGPAGSTAAAGAPGQSRGPACRRCTEGLGWWRTGRRGRQPAEGKGEAETQRVSNVHCTCLKPHASRQSTHLTRDLKSQNPPKPPKPQKPRKIQKISTTGSGAALARSTTASWTLPDPLPLSTTASWSLPELPEPRNHPPVACTAPLSPRPVREGWALRTLAALGRPREACSRRRPSAARDPACQTLPRRPHQPRLCRAARGAAQRPQPW